MQAKVKLPPDCGSQEGITSLYEYWGDLLYRELVKEDKVVVNLASKEYSKAIEPFLTPEITYLTCVFGILEADKKGRPKVKVKATEAKMARGEMVRFLAERGAEDFETVKQFDRLGFRFSPERSDEKQLVFVK